MVPSSGSFRGKGSSVRRWWKPPGDHVPQSSSEEFRIPVFSLCFLVTSVIKPPHQFIERRFLVVHRCSLQASGFYCSSCFSCSDLRLSPLLNTILTCNVLNCKDTFNTSCVSPSLPLSCKHVMLRTYITVMISVNIGTVINHHYARTQFTIIITVDKNKKVWLLHAQCALHIKHRKHNKQIQLSHKRT